MSEPNNTSQEQPNLQNQNELSETKAQAKIISDKPALNMPNPINSFLIIVIIILIALSGFLGWQNYNLLTAPDPTSIPTPSPQTSPSPSPSPTDTTSIWNTYEIESLGLTYKAPYELSVTLEEPDKNTVTLYIQNSETYYECEEENNCYYQLYLFSQTDATYSETDLESFKENLIESSIKDLNVAGHPALEGQIEGERNRFVTYIIKDKTLITIFTSDPTAKNKNLTTQILQTFKFK